MPGDIGRLRFGPPILSSPPDVLEAVDDGGKGGRLLRDGVLFYAENGMVAFSDPRWIQGAFNTLVGLFDRLGLRTNFRKTVGMVCRPCEVVGNQSEAAYGRLIMGEVPTYQEQEKGLIQFMECGGDMVVGSVVGHKMTHHVRAEEA